jgi:formylmethanofuran dehydrogenase subunit B
VTAPGGERVVASAVCLGCGCACDDIEVVVRGGRIAEARRACPLGAAWFGDGRAPARALVGGREATREAALDAAAGLLAGAARPLVYLAPELSCEAQRESAALADVLHAALDSVTSDTVMASVLAMQERGRASATLGEVRNRGDVLVCWGVDPGRRYPRYPSRYAPEPAGMFVPDGRRSRTVVAVEVGDSGAPDDADLRVAVAPEDEVAVLTALRALADAAAAGVPPRPGRDGPAWAAARALAPPLLARATSCWCTTPSRRRASRPTRRAPTVGGPTWGAPTRSWRSPRPSTGPRGAR